MKNVVFGFILLVYISSFGQEKPFFEQKAFDFYKTTIIDSFPVKKKIRVYKYFFDFHGGIEIDFFDSTCSKKGIKFEEMKDYTREQWKTTSKNFEIDYSKIDRSKFKIKKRVRNKYPRMFITAPHREINNNNKVFINIHIEESLYFKSIFQLELNNSGKVLNWCRDNFETVIIK